MEERVRSVGLSAFEVFMRTRSQAFVALLSLLALAAIPSQAMAQVRRPGIRRGTPPPSAPLPPQAPAVANALSYHRARWSVEGYSLISTYQVPVGNGVSSSTSFGGGTHGGFRLNNHYSIGVDGTAAYSSSPITSETVEAGVRYMPLSLEGSLRPFFDARGMFTHMYDEYSSQGAGIGFSQFDQYSRYSRGLGAIAGAGVERSITRSLSLTTEILAMRSRMTAYRVTGPGTIPAGTSYSITSFRYTLGLKYNRMSIMRQTQNTNLR
jgi:hypothetical protein